MIKATSTCRSCLAYCPVEVIIDDGPVVKVGESPRAALRGIHLSKGTGAHRHAQRPAPSPSQPEAAATGSIRKSWGAPILLIQVSSRPIPTLFSGRPSAVSS
jgi:anaerobic selenocysteine-containing dehydrogenase